MTLIDILERNAATYPNQPAIHWRDEGSWRSLDWAGYCIGLWMAGEVFLVADVSGVLGAVQHARPQLFLGVPRIWEKFQSGLLNRLESEQNERRRRIALSAVETGREIVRGSKRESRPGFGSVFDSGYSIGSSSPSPARAGYGPIGVRDHRRRTH